MKSYLKNSIVLAILISAIFTNEIQKNNAKTSKLTYLINLANDILGEISSDGSVSRGAISYALGSNGGYTLKDETVIIII